MNARRKDPGSRALLVARLLLLGLAVGDVGCLSGLSRVGSAGARLISSPAPPPASTPPASTDPGDSTPAAGDAAPDKPGEASARKGWTVADELDDWDASFGPDYGWSTGTCPDDGSRPCNASATEGDGEVKAGDGAESAEACASGCAGEPSSALLSPELAPPPSDTSV